MPTVSVVVVSYNARGALRACLNAVARDGHEVVVIDNASSDGSADLVRTEFPAARLVEMDKNAGFGAAVNAGLQTTDGRYVLILNPDAWPLDGALERLIVRAERVASTALLGPRLVDAQGTPQRSIIRQPQGVSALVFWTVFPGVVSSAYATWRRLLGFIGGEAIREGEFLVGAALLLRRAAVEQVGGFDESFFMFNEEADLCLRLQRAGWRIEFVPSATFVHIGGASTRIAPEQMYREQIRSHLRFFAKHRSMRKAALARRLLIVALRLRSFTGGGTSARSAAAWLASAGPEELLRPRA
jgi:N-acetylglucosaminyl-diphospho-decaprenol L-rhamnosyltransferase